MRRALVTLLLTVGASLAFAPGASAAFEWLGQYGLGYPGSGPGAMAIASGVSVSPAGIVAVVDSSNNRVELFSESGRFLRAFGKDVSSSGGTGPEVCTNDCKTGAAGSAAGELSGPWGVAAGPTEIYVSEIGNNRISAFDYEGHFLRAFGKDVGGPGVNVCTSVCGPGTISEAAGAFASPYGLALDASGRLYVANLSVLRVDVLNPVTGQFVHGFGKNVGGPGVDVCTGPCVAGSISPVPGALQAPIGVAVAGNGTGDVFVAEATSKQVSAFTQNGTFLREFGGPGSGAGQIETPYGVALDTAGGVYVTDSGNYRLDAFGEGGDFRFAFGKNVIPGGATGPEVCTVVCQKGENAGSAAVGEFVILWAIASDCRGAIYVSTVGRIDKFGDPASRTPPCPSNAFTIGKVKKNKKKGTATVEVLVSGPGSLLAGAGKSMSANAPQPQAAGTVFVTVKAAGKGVKALKRKGKLKGTLTLTFTPPNGDPNTQSEALTLVKKHKHRKHKGGNGGSK